MERERDRERGGRQGHALSGYCGVPFLGLRPQGSVSVTTLTAVHVV